MFSRAHKVTQTALAEAIGLFLAENIDTPRGQLPAQLKRCIAKAEEIEYENRKRGPD